MLKHRLYFFMLCLLIAISLSSYASGVRIDLSGQIEGNIYRKGQSVDIRVTVSEPSYLIVYGLDMDGDVRILFPNSDTQSNYVRPGSIFLTRYYNVLADAGGPVFLFAIASRDRRLSFSYRESQIPLWSSYWPEYHPVYSFISSSGFGYGSDFPLVLAGRNQIYRNSRNIYRGSSDAIYRIPYDQISEDFRNFERTIEYFIDDLNGAVIRFNFPFYYHSSELYVLGQEETESYNTVFDHYLNPYGYWVFIGGVRVWKPYVSYQWRPFVHGYWRWSPGIRNWIWISFEPWNLTYYYGYWYFDYWYGWVWLPDFEWHPPMVVFYYIRGYVGWRPAPLPHVYHSRIRNYNYDYSHPSYNPYVFVTSKDFVSSDVSMRVLPDSIFSSKIKPKLQSSQVQEFQDGAKFLEKVMPAERLTIKTADLEKAGLDTGTSEKFEAIIPKLDKSQKESLKTKQSQIMKEVNVQKKKAPVQEKKEQIKDAKENSVTEKKKLKHTDGPIKREKTE